MPSPWESQEYALLALENIDRRFLPGTAQEVDFILAELDVQPGSKIIDLGCGAGRHSIELAKRGYEVFGIDVSETMLQEAAKRAERQGLAIHFCRESLARLSDLLPTLPHHFDGAICLCESGLGVLGGQEKDLEFLQTIKECLRPGGKLILTELNGLRRYIRSEASPQFDCVEGVFHWSAVLPSGATLQEDQRLYTPAEASFIFRLAGFHQVEVFGCAPGRFERAPLGKEDVEMMLVGTNGISNPGTARS